VTVAQTERPSSSAPPRRGVAVYSVKKRLLLAQTTAPPAEGTAVLAERLTVSIFSGATPVSALPAEQLAALSATVGTERLRRRLAHPHVTLVLGVDPRLKRPAGFRWALHPRDEIVWHDNVPVAPGVAHGFHAFTYPEYRRQGVYKELIRQGNRFLFEHVGCAKVNIVVESTNQASLGANLDAGYAIEATNYLVKVLGRNVLSMFRDHASGAVRAHWVYRRGSRSGL